MRKVLTTALAAVTAAGAVLATAAPAQADRYRHHRGGGDDEVAAAILGGVAGLALGAALSSKGDRRDRGYYSGYSHDPRYDSYRGGYYRDDYYRDGRYRDGYYRDSYRAPRYAHRTCITRDRVYDPYIGRRVTIERRYAC